jgi:hypothetical protein
MLASLEEIGGDDLERDLGVLDPGRYSLREDKAGELLAIDEERGEALALDEVADPGALHAEQVLGRLDAIGEDMAGMIADLLGGNA